MGPRPGATVRQLTAIGNLDAAAASPAPSVSATVATYPFHGPFAAIEDVANQHNAVTIDLANGRCAVVTNTRSLRDIHLTYRGVPYQVEVFDPPPALASSGKVTVVE
jgi:hypothetical protein